MSRSFQPQNRTLPAEPSSFYTTIIPRTSVSLMVYSVCNCTTVFNHFSFQVPSSTCSSSRFVSCLLSRTTILPRSLPTLFAPFRSSSLPRRTHDALPCPKSSAAITFSLLSIYSIPVQLRNLLLLLYSLFQPVLVNSEPLGLVSIFLLSTSLPFTFSESPERPPTPAHPRSHSLSL